MANKFVSVDITRTSRHFDGNSALTGYGHVDGKSHTFSTGYGDGYADVHIRLVPSVSSSPFKLLKDSQSK